MKKLELLEKDLVELEDLVFRSGKYRPWLKNAVNYRISIWEEKLKNLPFVVKVINYEEIKGLKVRALSIRSLK